MPLLVCDMVIQPIFSTKFALAITGINVWYGSCLPRIYYQVCQYVFPPPLKKKYFLWPPSLSNYSSTCFLFSVTLLCSLSLLSDQLLLYNLSVWFPSHFPAIIHQISAIVKSMKFSILCLHFLSETYLFANYPLAAENPLSVSLQATETCILLRVMLQ